MYPVILLAVMPLRNGVGAFHLSNTVGFSIYLFIFFLYFDFEEMARKKTSITVVLLL